MKESAQNNAPRRISWKNILTLQAVVVLYTLASAAGKGASGQDFLSFRFLLFYAVEIALLGVYALLWQQLIKHIPLSVAYANRAVAILWSMVWAVVFFHESITVQNVLGVAIVLAGTLVVNSDDE